MRNNAHASHTTSNYKKVHDCARLIENSLVRKTVYADKKGAEMDEKRGQGCYPIAKSVWSKAVELEASDHWDSTPAWSVRYEAQKAESSLR